MCEISRRQVLAGGAAVAAAVAALPSEALAGLDALANVPQPVEVTILEGEYVGFKGDGDRRGLSRLRKALGDVAMLVSPTEDRFCSSRTWWMHNFDDESAAVQYVLLID